MSIGSDLPDDLARLFPDGAHGWAPPVQLPPGHVVTAKTPLRPTVDETGSAWDWERQGIVGPPVCWVTDGPVPIGLWSQLRAAHHRSGVWPVLLLDGVEDHVFGWFCEDESSLERLDPATLLRDWWDGFDHRLLTRSERRALGLNVPRWPGYKQDRPGWPGLAPPGASDADPDLAAEELAEAAVAGDASAKLALVAASRSADSLALAGWSNTDDESHFTGALSAVVRSWEGRFGARVISVGNGTLSLSVAAPPTTIDHALRVAVEHFAFCPEVDPREDYAYNSDRPWFTQYAESIVDQHAWLFWWD